MAYRARQSSAKATLPPPALAAIAPIVRAAPRGCKGGGARGGAEGEARPVDGTSLELFGGELRPGFTPLDESEWREN